jgi:Putative lumazine-binding
MSKNLKTVPPQDDEEVVSTVVKYAEGLRVGNVDGVAEAFDKNAVMYGFTNGGLLGSPIKNLYDFVEKNGTAPEIKTRIDVLAITPTTAVVRVDMEKDAIGADYTDFHTLIKLDSTWQRSITCMRIKIPRALGRSRAPEPRGIGDLIDKVVMAF